jgi:SAM-dependent methyltransferase
MSQSDPKNQPFDEYYFSTGPYAGVDFSRYSQYWWSNRYYAILARRYINPWALDHAKVNVPVGKFLLLSGDMPYAFPGAVFDILIAKHVVEHLRDPDQAVAEMSRVLKPGGLLILATPNLSSLMRKRKKEHWIGYKDPTHISLRAPEDWLSSLRMHGLRPFRVFSDGFWDAPYIPVVPASLQKLFFGFPGGLQAVLGWSIIPLRMGESLIILAEKA